LESALSKLAAKQITAHTLTIKLKYHDFVQITRSKTLPQAITSTEGFETVLADLLKDTYTAINFALFNQHPKHPL
jgi:DNA polymerase IV